jgi:Limiting CO2-inducible proteins B/C beta carbonyic anhydrases
MPMLVMTLQSSEYLRCEMMMAHHHDDTDPLLHNLSVCLLVCLQTTLLKISHAFPKAVSNPELVSRTATVLSKYNFNPSKTLLASSLCCDEVSRTLEEDFTKIYGRHFSIGGLAGFPFGGLTAFGAMAAHIPDEGSCLIVYGPHVGVDSDGTVGTVNRHGQAHSGSCCGSAVAAHGYVTKVHQGLIKASGLSADPLDTEQAYVGNMLLPFAKRLADAKEPMVELPMAMWDAQDTLMRKIVDRGSTRLHGVLALLGGIQINTPEDMADYFLPMRFELRDKTGAVVSNLMDDF